MREGRLSPSKGFDLSAVLGFTAQSRVIPGGNTQELILRPFDNLAPCFQACATCSVNLRCKAALNLS